MFAHEKGKPVNNLKDANWTGLPMQELELIKKLNMKCQPETELCISITAYFICSF
jgi:hypothetical protein